MKTRNFNVAWANKSTKDWKKEPIRTTRVEVPNASTEIGIAAKSALQIFSEVNGSLAKVDVLSIQEVDMLGNAVGEPIIPDADNSVIPTKK